MDNLELTILLDRASKKSFIEAILFLKENEKEYKSSKFYKTTKINLMQLFKNFKQEQTINSGIKEILNNWVEELDTETIKNKLMIAFEALLESDGVKELLQKYSPENLEENLEELEKQIKSLKKD